MDFCQLVALGVVQQHDDAMVIAKLGEGRVEASQPDVTGVVFCRIVWPRHAGQALTWQAALVDDVQALPGEAPPFVDKQVVHDPAQPRAGFVDLDEVVELREGPGQQLLEQVFGLVFGAGQAPGEAIQAIEVRPDQALEREMMFAAAHYRIEFKGVALRSKDPIGAFVHLTYMNKKFLPAITGTAIAIAITSLMDATGYFMFSALALCPLVGLAWYLQRVSRREIGLLWGPRNMYALALAYPVLVLGSTALVALAGGAVDTTSTDWGKTWLNVFLLSSTGIFAALLTEEAFFRGWLWAALKRAGQTDLQVLIWTSVAFAVWHIPAISLDTGFDVPAQEIPIYLVNATLLGLIWGVLRMVSGSIVVPAVSHAVWNGIDYPLFGFGEKVGALGIQETHIFGPEVGWLGVALNTIAFAVLLAIARRRQLTA